MTEPCYCGSPDCNWCYPGNDYDFEVLCQEAESLRWEVDHSSPVPGDDEGEAAYQAAILQLRELEADIERVQNNRRRSSDERLDRDIDWYLNKYRSNDD